MNTFEWLGIVAFLVALIVWLWQLRRIPAVTCLHVTQVRGVVDALGEARSMRVPVKRGTTEYCLDCIGKMTIRCVWCGGTIWVGDPITLYAAGEEGDGRSARPDATSYQEDEHDEWGRYIGCLRVGCAVTGGDRSGFWVIPGRVERVPTAWELSQADLARGGDGIVIINDLSKP